MYQTRHSLKAGSQSLDREIREAKTTKRSLNKQNRIKEPRTHSLSVEHQKQEEGPRRRSSSEGLITQSPEYKKSKSDTDVQDLQQRRVSFRDEVGLTSGIYKNKYTSIQNTFAAWQDREKRAISKERETKEELIPILKNSSRTASQSSVYEEAQETIDSDTETINRNIEIKPSTETDQSSSQDYNQTTIETRSGFIIENKDSPRENIQIQLREGDQKGLQTQDYKVVPEQNDNITAQEERSSSSEEATSISSGESSPFVREHKKELENLSKGLEERLRLVGASGSTISTQSGKTDCLTQRITSGAGEANKQKKQKQDWFQPTLPRNIAEISDSDESTFGEDTFIKTTTKEDNAKNVPQNIQDLEDLIGETASIWEDRRDPEFSGKNTIVKLIKEDTAARKICSEENSKIVLGTSISKNPTLLIESTGTNFNFCKTVGGERQEQTKKGEILNQVTKSYKESSDNLCREEEDYEMAYATPAIFHGSSKENADSWLRHATWWLSTTRAGQADNLVAKLHQIAILFQDEAETWFASLNIDIGHSSDTSRMHLHNEENRTPGIRTWEDFVIAFKERFKRDESERTSEVTALMQAKQGKEQTVEDFVTSIRKKGNLIGATKEEVYMAVVSGLKTNLKAQIMQFNPTTIEDVMKRGKIAELYPIRVEEERSLDTEKLLKAINEIRSESVSDRRRGQTPPRVRFNDQRRSSERSASPFNRNEANNNRYEQQRGNTGSGNRYDNIERRDRYFNQYRNNNYGDEPQQRWDTNQEIRGGEQQQPDSRGSNRPFEEENRRSTSFNMQNNQERCPNCARSHQQGARCPAFGTTCSNCGKRNHWRVACRGGRGTGHGRPGNFGNFSQERNPPGRRF